MKLTRRSRRVGRLLFGFWLVLRRLIPKKRCRAFVAQGEGDAGISRVYVINLDRESLRWSRMQQELGHVLDSSGSSLLECTERHSAIDGGATAANQLEDADVDPIYTLRDQLFVEPQPLVLPTRFELDLPIRMSRAEVGVARSHVAVWRRVADGDHDYVLVLEDDVWLHSGFARRLEQAWAEALMGSDTGPILDILYVSYLEVKHGAPKTSLSPNLLRPTRGLWHLCAYVLSKAGAEKLLRALPCRGPVDLWINQQFDSLNVIAVKRPIADQRRDTESSNSYSVLPSLTSIGAINSEVASLFHLRPTRHPVFAFGPEGSGQSSLASSLSMLGYRCCSDLNTLPTPELERLLEGRGGRVFDAYVNVGVLEQKVQVLRGRYPDAKFFLTAPGPGSQVCADTEAKDALLGADVTVLPKEEGDKWKLVCEHLECAPPGCSFPTLPDIGQRQVLVGAVGEATSEKEVPERDKSPWVAEQRGWWRGIECSEVEGAKLDAVQTTRFTDSMDKLDGRRWYLRSDTFIDNLALFRPSNAAFRATAGATLTVRRESLGVREFSAASLCSRDRYLYGRFEARFQASDAPGVITGFFLHRNSPRQEIDIEIAGNRPDRLLLNVFYNPGGEGARFDYGYRGAPSYVDLGFDASSEPHSFAIEWSPCEIRWYVDDQLVHRRALWDPTPIPDLPMSLHVNCWPSRSTQLAGRVSSRRLPAIARVESIAIEASAAAPSCDR
jgi:GR25 family glycosyltransferase involved in LPS biosynthesis